MAQGCLPELFHKHKTVFPQVKRRNTVILVFDNSVCAAAEPKKS